MAHDVYFCGSIRGGRDDAALYARIIAHVGATHGRVLTEHVGAVALGAMGEDALSEREIHDRDLRWLTACTGLLRIGGQTRVCGCWTVRGCCLLMRKRPVPRTRTRTLGPVHAREQGSGRAACDCAVRSCGG